MSPAKAWAVPLLGVGLLAAVWALRPSEPARPAARPRGAAPLPPPGPAPEPAAAPAARPAPLPPAPPREVARALESARVRATWENYRNALASGNDGLAAALVPILRRDREEVLRLAEEELGRARSPQEREAARRALEVLR